MNSQNMLVIYGHFFFFSQELRLGPPVLLTLQHQYATPPYCSLYITYRADKDNLLNNRELLWLLIVSLILLILVFDSGMILWEEIKCSSRSNRDVH